MKDGKTVEEYAPTGQSPFELNRVDSAVQEVWIQSLNRFMAFYLAVQRRNRSCPARRVVSGG